jgi:hypothetical protein
MRLPLLMRKIHKWLSLLIGLQVLFWIVGGLIMSYLPLDEIKAKHLIEKHELSISNEPVVPIATVLQAHPKEALKVSLVPTYFGELYQVEGPEEQLSFYNAKTGQPVEQLTKAQAEEAAKYFYKGPEQINQVQLWDQTSFEYRGPLPVWRVDFNDSSNTTFYIDRHSGLLSTARTTGWRVFDFVWMLHIMDYSDRTDFNTWWLVMFAFIALLFALSGVYILINSLTKKRPKASA